jgi:hypothetical protein
MQKSGIRVFLIYVLPATHLCACIIIAFLQLEFAWQYLATADTLMSIPIVALSYNYDHPLLLFGVLGTLWWYLLSWLADYLIRLAGSKFARSNQAISPAERGSGAPLGRA